MGGGLPGGGPPPYFHVICHNVKYSKAELVQAVQIERTELIKELNRLTRRIAQIQARLDELDKADNLLEGVE